MEKERSQQQKKKKTKKKMRQLSNDLAFLKSFFSFFPNPKQARRLPPGRAGIRKARARPSAGDAEKARGGGGGSCGGGTAPEQQQQQQ